MRRLFPLLALVASCASYSVTVVPAANAPHLAASDAMRVTRDAAPEGARELARIELSGHDADSARECEDRLGFEGKKLGADFVRVLDEGRHVSPTAALWSAPWCTGMAYTTHPSQ